MKVLVCGGRNFNDWELLSRTLNSLNGVTTIISGHARGADKMGESFANQMGWSLDVYPAKWDIYGKSAGYKRNMQMLVEGKPDLVVAFPGGIGTAMMVKIATDADVNILDCREM